MSNEQKHIESLEQFHTKCRTIYTIFLSGNKEQKDNLQDQVHKLRRCLFEYTMTLEMLESLLALERNIMPAKGTQKQHIENGIFECIQSCVHYWKFQDPEKAESDSTEQATDRKQAKIEDQREKMALALIQFAGEVFAFKLARDNFSSKRKAHALRVLSELSYWYDFPEAYDLSITALKSKKPDLAREAFNFFKQYAKVRNNVLPDEVLLLLEKLIEQTSNRSIAAGALGVKVETGYANRLRELERNNRPILLVFSSVFFVVAIVT